MKFPPYPRYKESGFECYGQVPSNWLVERIDRLFSQRREEPLPEDRLVSAFITGEVTLRDNKTDNIIKNSGYEIGYKRIRKGDLVISGMNAHLGGLGISDSDGKGSPVNLVLKPVTDLERNFFSYLLRHLAKSQYIKSLVNTIRFNSSDFKSQDLKSIFVLVPPIEEQKAIAEFLDAETLKIDELIGKQERLIALLQEKRQALISHAVTKGLNPNAPMKNSGIEWLGEIPEHWTALPLKRKLKVTDCKHHTVSFVEEGFPVASIKEVRNGYLDLSNAKRTTEKEYLFLIEGRTPQKGDIIYSRNATVGAAAYVNTEEKFCMGQDVCLITSDNLDNRFFWYQFQSNLIVNQLNSLLLGATFNRINVADIKEFVVCSPSLNEQKELVEYLDHQTAKIDALKGKARQAIELLQEHRTALISSAVTGKIDVRRNFIGSENNG
jgi:type I restriction enzyme S subunit